MVSFQCNGCGDVLTKPKLDKHRAMCHSSFDCIDCSKRFETPTDYKGHISCISEAEKYQKTLYTGGKLSGLERNNRNQRSRQQGGGRQRGGDRLQWQNRNTNQATGANDTPLGTPVRMSPVNGTPAIEENTQESQPTTETSKKRRAEPEAAESKDTSEPAKKKKKQKKAEGGPEMTEASVVKVKSRTKHKSTSEVAITEGSPQGFDPQPAEDRNKKEGTKKKEKRKKKEDPLSSGQRPSSGPTVDAKDSVTVEPPATEVPPTIQKEARSTKKKPKLKTIDEAADAPASGKSSQPTSPEIAAVAQDDQRDRKKRRKSGNYADDDGDGKRVAQGNDGSLKEKRKEKKKKHKSPGQTAGVVE